MAGDFPMRKATTKNQWIGGFTILELMITLGIVALLATIGIPAYERHVMKTKRADAQTALLELSHFMERNYAKNGGYLVNGAPPTLPFSVTPRDSGNPSYSISLTNVTAQSYTLQAQPLAASGQTNDPCGVLTLTHTGVTTPTTNNCWIQ
jgi:type IV pilus assembly protein PilE